MEDLGENNEIRGEEIESIILLFISLSGEDVGGIVV